MPPRYEEHQYRMTGRHVFFVSTMFLNSGSTRAASHVIDCQQQLNINEPLHVIAELKKMIHKLTAFVAQPRRHIGEGGGGWAYSKQ